MRKLAVPENSDWGVPANIMTPCEGVLGFLVSWCTRGVMIPNWLLWDCHVLTQGSTPHGIVCTYCPKLTLIPRHGIMMATAPPQDPTPVGTFTLRKDATNITASPCPLGKGRKRGEGRSLSGSRSSTSHEPAFRVLLYR